MQELFEQLLTFFSAPSTEVNEHGMPKESTRDGWSYTDREDLLKKPLSLRSSPQFRKTESLVDYIRDFIDQEKDPYRIFANIDKFFILAILDPHTHHDEGGASHQRHRPAISYKLAPEWLIWKNISGEWMSARDFQKFLENNLEYIVGEFKGVDVVNMCRSINVKTSGETTIKTEGSGGDRKLAITDDTSVTGEMNGAPTSFPETLDIQLRIFQFCEAFRFTPRLRVIPSDRGPVFCIDLKEPSIIEEGAFTHEVAVLKETFGEVLYGSVG